MVDLPWIGAIGEKLYRELNNSFSFAFDLTAQQNIKVTC